ncbi:phosphatase PAP2 family protein [Devosia sp.]|uniref:phosphatase PAP2 family protein n=1 Tax=Devosia sp. TaxID=1871048 RepID=UPI001AC57250|nr:phosphatase PAP2 family protein [Devosia sp.]MBN9309497.1 phosphatase PAP2 family protein [Devosia sp.]
MPSLPHMGGMIELDKTWPPGLNRRTALPFVAGFVLVIAVLYLFDHAISAWGQEVSQPVRYVFRWITRWGESDWILIPTVLGWLGGWLLSRVTRDRIKLVAAEFAAVTGFIFVGVGLPSLVATLLKRAFGRGRPETWTAEAPLSFRPFNLADHVYQSFPSGHATTAFSLAAVVAFLWPRAFWPALIFAVLVSVSRVMLGQHYPTDITAGAVLGVLGAYAVRNVFVARGWLFESADGRIVRRTFEARVRH